ncbi:uncharacterized protein EAE98_006286 [Botrytis deweyae]|uniref:Uncharacterized protein n=2 Tax=Botrytis TaxID=33196 RepID=A0A4Z1JQM6_9HELO|nr:uncharacterized protein EAE98_006286 [Botrytis deweyae]KAF7926902.1 hypothetical protein EAE98_006286 [Botrytis deweyae]KAF7929109.1 hypothetical protein EAE99_004853 [Botrytis elliptica]TGO71583.1 hypothetical protein BELL_0555g00040 [Botrytis elliptica]
MSTNKITPSPKATVAPIDASGPPGKYTISFGSHRFVVELSKVPWLGAYINLVPRDNASYTQPGYESEYEPDQSVPYLFIAAQGVINGYYFCFNMLPPELSYYYKLCQALDVISAKNLSSSPESLLGLWNSILLYTDPKTSQDDRMLHRARAGTAAFKFVYLMILGDFPDSNVRDSKQILALLFVQTVLYNQDDFMWEIRKVVRAAYQVRFETTWEEFQRFDDFGGQTETKLEDFDIKEAAKEAAAKAEAEKKQAAKQKASIR